MCFRNWIRVNVQSKTLLWSGFFLVQFVDKIFNGKEWINAVKQHSDWELWDNIHTEPDPGLLFAYSKQEIFKQKKETKQAPHGTVDEENKQ